MMRFRVLVGFLAASALAACASTSPPPPLASLNRVADESPPSQRVTTALAPPPVATTSPEAPSQGDLAAVETAKALLSDHAHPEGLGFTSLVGWEQDDHVADFMALVSGCPAMREPAAAKVCRRAMELGQPDETQARRFLEANFRPEPISEPGLLTAYYTPLYEARDKPEGDFTAPVRPRPAGLPRHASDIAGPVYPDRAWIERRPAPDALAWMKPEDLFFLQIQGSAVLTFPEGARLRATFDGTNGAPFLGIAAPMRRRGLLPDNDTSGESIRAWLASHRGEPANTIMRLNRRYVFFRLEPDDGAEPNGAAGLRLIPGRAIAVDPSKHPMGEALWIDGTSPILSGAFPSYRRMAFALDTGGAIKGSVRADLYLGRGPEAGLEAGRVRHILHLYRLTPVETPIL